jgi:hypothetical protein
VLVNVGAVPPGHLTDAGQVTARAVPSAVNCKTRLYTTAPAGKLFKLNVVMTAVIVSYALDYSAFIHFT